MFRGGGGGVFAYPLTTEGIHPPREEKQQLQINYALPTQEIELLLH